MGIFLELLKLGAVGVIAGLFSSYLANRDYRSRKWWELRVGAYQSAIDSFSDLIYYYDSHYSATIEYRELSDDYKKKLNEHWESGFHKIRKSADSGAFLFSPEANAALKEFMNIDNAPSNNYVEQLDNQLAGAKQCLKTLVECSKIDLLLKPSLFDRIA